MPVENYEVIVRVLAIVHHNRKDCLELVTVAQSSKTLVLEALQLSIFPAGTFYAGCGQTFFSLDDINL